MPRHRSGLDLSAKPIAHHHFITLPPLFHEPWHFAEVIAVVSVAHYDEGATRRRNSSAQGRTVSSRLDAYHTRARVLRNFDRAVGRTVVRYDYFASQPCCMKSVYRFRHANPNGVSLIQTRNHYGHFGAALRIGGNAQLVRHP